VLVLYHDIPSAASLCAVLRLQRLADEGLPVAFRGFDVLGIEATIPATLDDLQDWTTHRAEAADLGWALDRPRVHPPTLMAHLVAELAEEANLGAAFRSALYRAHWLDGRDIADARDLFDLAVGVGLAPTAVQELLDDPEGRHRLRRRMLAHRGDGIGGVPVLDAGGTFVSPFMDEADLRHLATL
jgi:predicted DsbA family dithiol-disulfide isomerase